MLCSYATVGCLSVRLCVTMRYDDHIGWNVSKINSWLINLRSWPGSHQPQQRRSGLVQREHPIIRLFCLQNLELIAGRLVIVVTSETLFISN